MQHSLLRRVLLLPLTLLGLSLFAYLIVSIAPGDPVTMELRRMGVGYTPETLAELRHQYGLDRPLPVRFVRWLGDALTLDFGRSLTSGRDVAEVVLTALVPTLWLASGALAIAITIAVGGGLLAAFGGPVADGASRTLAIVLSAVPSYWLALLLLYVVALRLGWTKVIGDGRLSDMLLPALTLGLLLGATYARVVHERVVQTLREPFVRFAVIKGVPRRRILMRHVLKNALLPLVNLGGMAFGYLIGGSVVVETIFGWPGLGNLVMKAIGDRDIPMLQAYLVLCGTAYVLIAFAADMLSLALDPRQRRDAGRHAA